LLADLRCDISRGPDGRATLARQLAGNPCDPRMKLYATWQTLQFRRDHAELFRAGEYLPLSVTGARASHVLAFARQLQNASGASQVAIIIVPRLLARLARATDGAAPAHQALQAEISSLGQLAWQDTSIVLPESLKGPLLNLFTGRALGSGLSTLSAAEIFTEFPVALLSG
jgi:(1->4)-alpha-D-glucan 1-alpha-D-glucosylmutase